MTVGKGIQEGYYEKIKKGRTIRSTQIYYRGQPSPLLKFFADNQSNIVVFRSYPDVYKFYSSSAENTLTQDEFKMLIGDLSVRGLLWISQDIEDFAEIYQASAILWEQTNDKLPRLIVTEVAEKFLEFISFSHGA